MIVFYRITSIASTNPSPLYNNDKLRLNQFCLRSFVTAFRDVKPKMIFIADYCGKEYDEIIASIVPFPFEIVYTAEGQNATALRQYDMAYKDKDKDEIVLFQECDYLYRPSVGKQMVEAIEHFGLFSPYDHPDFYTRFDIHDEVNRIELFNNNHYRTAKRNTMTFGMRRDFFERHYKTLMKHGYLDGPVWDEMREFGGQLHTPIPAMATHMAENYMAPAIPWETVFKIYE